MENALRRLFLETDYLEGVREDHALLVYSPFYLVLLHQFFTEGLNVLKGLLHPKAQQLDTALLVLLTVIVSTASAVLTRIAKKRHRPGPSGDR